MYKFISVVTTGNNKIISFHASLKYLEKNISISVFDIIAEAHPKIFRKSFRKKYTKNFAKFTGTHKLWCSFLVKFQATSKIGLFETKSVTILANSPILDVATNLCGFL